MLLQGPPFLDILDKSIQTPSFHVSNNYIEKKILPDHSSGTSPIGGKVIKDLVTALNTKGAGGQPEKWSVGDDTVNLKELKHIHYFLSQTICPSWDTLLPRNLGEPNHRKLKADHWQSCIEFDVPVAVAKIWIHDTWESEGEGV